VKHHGVVHIDLYKMERVLEERLREAVCLGDTDAVQDLVNLGVDVNARQPVNGWYYLFYLCFNIFIKLAKICFHVYFLLG